MGVSKVEIYALFRNGKYFCAALIQGPEKKDDSGGQYDEVGDKRWLEATAKAERACICHEDWILIDEEDFQKYMLGRSGGDNGTGYIRDPETNHAVSAPAEEKTYEQEIAEIQENYKTQTAEIKDDYLDAVLTNNDTGIAEAKTRYATVTEENDNAVRDAIDKYFNDKGGD